jgi:catechol 2,3-dioxygenase-like lactoylglutathione lyase family enzyme
MIRRLWDVTLTVADLKESARFYGEVLGLQKKYEFGDYGGFDCGGVEIGLKTWGEQEEPRQGEPWEYPPDHPGRLGKYFAACAPR